MPAAIKAVLDANIIIAAITCYSPKRADLLKHRIHDEAHALLERLAESGIGYVVPAVRSEAFGALSRAVAGVMFQKLAGISPEQRMSPSDYPPAIVSSRKRLNEIILALNYVHPNIGHTMHNLRLVEKMSEDLKRRYRDLIDAAASAETQRRDMRSGRAGTRLPREMWQLERLMKKHPNRGDQRVLAEAMALRDSLPAGSRVMIASSDTGFFSPYRHPGGVSDAVAAEICRRFRIRCDHPEAILRMIGGPA